MGQKMNITAEQCENTARVTRKHKYLHSTPGWSTLFYFGVMSGRGTGILSFTRFPFTSLDICL